LQRDIGKKYFEISAISQEIEFASYCHPNCNGPWRILLNYLESIHRDFGEEYPKYGSFHSFPCFQLKELPNPATI